MADFEPLAPVRVCRAMANLRSAGSNLQFMLKLGQLDAELQKFLGTHGLCQVLTYTNFFENPPRSAEAA